MSERRFGRWKRYGVLFGAALMLAQSAALAAGERGWVISLSTRLNGNLVIYLGPDAMRVECIASGINVLVHKDSSKILVWNKNSHKMCETDWHQMTPLSGTNVMSGGYLTGLPLERSSATASGAIAGLDSMQYSMLKSARCPVRSVKAAAKDEFALVPRTGLTNAQFWVSTKLPISESECQVVRRITCLPPMGGIPLRLVLFTDTGAVCKELDTTKAVSQSLPASTFAEPKDCQKVKTEQDVCFNSTRLNRLMTVFDQWKDLP
jgi:hypothetical protein